MALHNETGKLGETLVRAILAQVGPVEASTAADVRFAGLDIEVKAARVSFYDQRKGPGFQFCLHRAGRRGMRADVVVLLAFVGDEAVPFVIPAAALSGQRKVAMRGTNPRAYTGQWAPWRDRWETLAEVATQKGAVWQN